MKQKKNNALVAFLLLMVVAVGIFAVRTYAKYTESFDTDSNATVAKWAFKDENESGTLTFALNDTYDADTLVANKIAPGTQGTLKISLSNEDSEVGVRYDITFDGGTNAPTNLKFYSDAACTTELTDNTKTGTLTPGQTATDVTVYWKWAYETLDDDDDPTDGDTADTTDGKSANDVTITATIKGTQVEPQ